MKNVEYCLTLNSSQAKETLKAVELLMRLKLNQFDVLPYNLVDVARKDYCNIRDNAKQYLDKLEEIFKPEIPGKYKDEEWYRLYNLYQVLRYNIHLAENPTGTGVDSYPPMKLTDEPLPDCEWRIKQQAGTNKKGSV